MCEQKLSKIVISRSLADREERLHGKLKVAQMSRLVTELVGQDGEVNYDVTFTFESNIIVINGKLTTALVLQCQRCLEAMVYPIVADVKLSPVLSDEQAESLPDGYDAVLLEQEKLNLYTIIEDELILQLPTVAKHEMDQCSLLMSAAEK